MTAYDFAFPVGAKVIVRPITVKAVVDAVMYTTGGSEYRVVYWWEGSRRTQWVYPGELDLQ